MRIIRIFLTGCLVLMQEWPLSSEVVSRIVAEVNGEIITSQELDTIIRPLSIKYQRAYGPEELAKKMEDARKSAVDQLIQRKLILQEAKKQNIVVDEDEIEKRLKLIKMKFDSEEEMFYTLEKEGLSLDQLRENLREQYLVRMLTRQEVTQSVAVSPRQITEYFNQHQDDYEEPERVQISQILIKKGDDASGARDEIEKAVQKLQGGAAFESVAKEFSVGPNADGGGALPFYAKGELLKELEKAAFSLEIGKTSGVIETPMGYHVLLVKARKKARKIPLSEVWTEIEDQLFQERAQEMHKVWIEELKKKAHIRIYI